jgi:DNA-binding XRE family transcriptional regulator
MIKNRKNMNKFAEWMKCNDKIQKGVAEKLNIAPSTLYLILANRQTPSLKLAYDIEKLTKGKVTLYDWLDQTE